MTTRRAVLGIALASLLAAVIGIWALPQRTSAAIPRAALASGPSERPAPAAGRAERNWNQTPTVAGEAEPAAAQARDVARHWHPRAADEWQGMLIDLDATPPCDSSAVCGLARACEQGRCVGCANDSQCSAGESCVLDHCVRRELVECKRRTDCASGQLCILSGYSSLPRGNEDMRSFCVSPMGGAGSPPPDPAPPPAEAPRPRAPRPDDELVKKALQASGAAQ